MAGGGSRFLEKSSGTAVLGPLCICAKIGLFYRTGKEQVTYSAEWTKWHLIHCALLLLYLYFMLSGKRGLSTNYPVSAGKSVSCLPVIKW